MKHHKMIVKLGSTFAFVLLSLLVLQSNSSAQVNEWRTPLKIVHLGDSYSAGNGARSAAGERNYSGVPGCYRSPTNWGSQFAQSLGDTFAVTYINRACSGGVLKNILNRRETKYLVPELSDGSCPSISVPYPDEQTVDHSEEYDGYCATFLNPQYDALDDSVDLVLMTIGGNDLGFDDIVRRCFVVGARSASGCREVVDQANSEIANLQEGLLTTFNEIRGKLRPDAKIVYVSYPHLLLDVDYFLFDQQNMYQYYMYDAGAEIRALASLGDTIQREAVAAANAAAGEEYIIYYDGTKSVFAGHEPDPSVLRRNPDRWIAEFEGDVIAEWYHPNALGHENWGEHLSIFETFGAAPGAFDTNSDIDVVFVVDTTGSMWDEIAQVRTDLTELVDQLANTTDSYRVAVVSYRDYPERTDDSIDYPSRVDQTFTDDLGLIQAAINSLTAEGGGDAPETVFSGIQAAIELPWRAGVTKIAIVIGDAPALSPEPISNLTTSQIVANSIAVDPVQVVGVDVAALNSNGALGEIVNGTGGSIISGTSDLTDAILTILDQAANQPFAWLGQAYAGKIGQPIQFDASGSYDPSRLPLTLYEWDFNGDGVFDLTTTDATATYTYNAAFDNFVILRVTGPGGSALASARTVVNAAGFASQGDESPCELDENGYSIIFDEENGRFIACTPTNLPDSDQDGVIEITDEALADALVNLGDAIVGLPSPLFGQKYDILVNAIGNDDTTTACRALRGLITLAQIQAGSKITLEEANAVIEAANALKPIIGCSG